ncbi:DNA-binding response regulator [Vibrio natriegens]|jgi:DNA-binding NarL/FixJ family response regulator|uniref:response regulator n=1 Tax=Vibrio TaxID=662 RepID=UPI000243BD54|nr:MULTISPECIES: response regulator transcription factor [Vibrio]AEX21089.1 response regulator receiver protein [Vibrio sp. EJY3]ANQ20752.1 DNA-binding response regulator [Vibrio natriegens]ANQ25583.1 DNA-binding response regulator [Vibrio natriegens]AXT70072.1 DNA-binding response regulator [Vibrio sp. dhg]MCY9877767.1 response regulator transcription factor [Vibrio natriegens]
MIYKSRVFIVDDHDIVRAGICSILNTLSSVEVVGESGTGLNLIPNLKKSKPDLLILDVSIKGINGIELVSMIRKHKIPINILMLSMHKNIEYVARCLRNGAQGYLLKDSAVEELELAVGSVMSGGSYISQKIDKPMLKDLLGKTQDAVPLDLLTSRQRQILQLIVEGYSTNKIADDTCISIKTVETHRSNIMKKLNIKDIPNLVRFAIENKLLVPTT